MPVYNYGNPDFSKKVFNFIVNSTPTNKTTVIINKDHSTGNIQSKTTYKTKELIIRWVANIATFGLLFLLAKSLNYWAKRSVKNITNTQQAGATQIVSNQIFTPSTSPNTNPITTASPPTPFYEEHPGPIYGNPIGSVIQEPPKIEGANQKGVPVKSVQNTVLTLRAVFNEINKSPNIHFVSGKTESKVIGNTNNPNIFTVVPIQHKNYLEENKELLDLLKSGGKAYKFGDEGYMITMIDEETVFITHDDLQLDFAIDNEGNITNTIVYLKDENDKFKKSGTSFSEEHYEIVNLAITELKYKVKPHLAINIEGSDPDQNSYYAWVSDENVLTIESEESISLFDGSNRMRLLLNENGSIQSVSINQNPFKADLPLPAHWSTLLNTALEKALVNSSSYKIYKGKKILGSVLRTGLRIVPEHHIAEIVDLVKQTGYPLSEISTNFVFLLDNLTKSIGIDEGGLSMEVVSESVEALCEKMQFSYDKGSSLYYPTSKDPLTTHSKEILENLGAFLLFLCQNKQKFVTGVLFDASLFQAIFSMSYHEALGSFEDLSERTKQNLLLTLYDSQNKEKPSSSNKAKHSNRDYLEIFYKTNWNDQDREVAKYFLENILMYDPNDEDDRVYFEDLQKSYSQSVKEDAYLSLFIQQLEPIHAIASGMAKLVQDKKHSTKDNLSWSALREIDPEKMSTSIQGSLDRSALKDFFVPGFTSNPEMKTNLELVCKWIKEWIQDPNTPDQDIKDFLKQLTGTTGISLEKHYKFSTKSASDSPLISIHTCFFRAEINGNVLLSQDFNKKSFMPKLLAACLGKDTDFTQL